MQYALLIHRPATGAPGDTDERAATPADLPTDGHDDWVSYTRALHAAGVLVAGEALQPGETATTVRRREDSYILVDGPFAETAEVLIGFYLIDVADLDEALAWAARLPDAAHYSVEVRPVAPTDASAVVVAAAAREA